MVLSNPQFLGNRNAGKKTGNLASTWFMGNNQFGTLNPDLPFAGMPVNALAGWYAFELDPIGVQGSFTFGEGRTMQVQIGRSKSWYAAPAHYNMAGRVVIAVPSTGQFFVFGAREVIVNNVATDVLPANAFFIENDNNIVPVYLSAGSKLQVFVEQDMNDGAASAPSSAVTLTLFNYTIAPISAE